MTDTTIVGLLNKAMNAIDGNRDGMDAVIGDIEEAMLGVGSLLNAARNLRAAQRAYMADRGNHELGRVVAQRAQELDEVLSENDT